VQKKGWKRKAQEDQVGGIGETGAEVQTGGSAAYTKTTWGSRKIGYLELLDLEGGQSRRFLWGLEVEGTGTRHLFALS